MAAYLPLFACGLMMLVCVVPMMRGRHDSGGPEGSEAEIDDLRAEVRELRARLDGDGEPSDRLT